MHKFYAPKSILEHKVLFTIKYVVCNPFLILPFYFRELLALLSQYADAKKSQCLEVLTSLQRIENMMVKQAEQNSLNYIVSADKLLSLISENLSSNESNEVLIEYI